MRTAQCSGDILSLSTWLTFAPFWINISTIFSSPKWYHVYLIEFLPNFSFVFWKRNYLFQLQNIEALFHFHRQCLHLRSQSIPERCPRFLKRKEFSPNPFISIRRLHSTTRRIFLIIYDVKFRSFAHRFKTNEIVWKFLSWYLRMTIIK